MKSVLHFKSIEYQKGNIMKKFLRTLPLLFMILALVASCAPAPTPLPPTEAPTVVPTEIPTKVPTEAPTAEPDLTPVRVASLKGPTTMGAVKLIQDSKVAGFSPATSFEIFGTADEIVPKLVQGELDVALIPANLASVLYNKTKGGIQVAAINTLGVLYILENGESIKSVADLAGKTIYSPGKGTSPEYVLRYILKQNGLDPDKDVSIEFKSEATEIAVLMQEQSDVIAFLPQPYATAVQMQNPKVRIALDMTAEWDRVSPQSGLVTGVVVVRKAFASEHPQVLASFLEAYNASTEYVNTHLDEASAWIAELGIVAKAPIAAKALPLCNISYIDGEPMKTRLSGYLQVLFDANPASVGGALPADDFYLLP